MMTNDSETACHRNGRHLQPRSLRNEFNPAMNEWSLALAGVLALVSIAILAVLSILPSTACAQVGASATHPARQGSHLPGFDDGFVFGPVRPRQIEPDLTVAAAHARTGPYLPGSTDAQAAVQQGPAGMSSEVERMLTFGPGDSAVKWRTESPELRGGSAGPG